MDVKLWAAPGGAGGGGSAGPNGGGGGADEGPLPRGPKATWDGVTRPRFNPGGTQVRQRGRAARLGFLSAVHGRAAGE